MIAQASGVSYSNHRCGNPKASYVTSRLAPPDDQGCQLANLTRELLHTKHPAVSTDISLTTPVRARRYGWAKLEGYTASMAQLAAEGKTASSGGLNSADVRVVLGGFGQDSSGTSSSMRTRLSNYLLTLTTEQKESAGWAEEDWCHVEPGSCASSDGFSSRLASFLQHCYTPI